jgi:lysophospholipase L1-like esterase
MSVVPRPRSLTLFVLTALAAVVGQLGLPIGASAATVNYAALGDSYSSGVGADDYDLASGTCLRGSHAYPVLWKAAHAVSSFSFVACGGATTDTVRSTQLGVLNAATTLVTITVGGNDLGFANVVITCKTGTTSACASAVAGAENQARTVLPAKLAATYADIKAKAPNARLVVLGYPRLFETTSCGLLSMSPANRTVLNQGADVLESVIQARASAAGATYVSANSWFDGHRVCAARPWINGTVALIVDSYHPNASGYSQAYLPALTAVTG